MESSTQRNAPESPGFAGILAPLFCSALAFAVAEAWAAATGSGVAAASDQLRVFSLAMGWALAPLLTACFLFSTLLHLPSTRRFVHILRGLLGWAGPGGALCATLMGAGVLFCGVVIGAGFGRVLVENLSPRFAALGIAFGTALLLVVLFLLAAQLAAFLSQFAEPAARAAPPWLVRRAFSGLFLAVGLLTTPILRTVLPPDYAVAPTLALLALGIALWPSAHLRLTTLFRGRRGSGLVVALLALCLPLGSGLDRAPASVQSALHYGAPYLSLLVGGLDHKGEGDDARRTGDKDGDEAPRFIPAKQPKSDRNPALPKRMNLVVILVDALRYDHLGFAGYARPVSPNLDSFRERATWFEHAYTPAPSTRFAMASVFTGLDPIHLPFKGGGGNRFRLLKEAGTLAEILAKDGYDRVGFTISYVLHKNKGTGQGFRVWKTPWPTDGWKKAHGKAATLTTNAALGYLGETELFGVEKEKGIEKEKGEFDRFLLFLHYRCTHDPYIKHEQWDYGDKAMDRYDSALNYCDQEIGRVFDAIDAHPARDNTAVILFSDHGELFGEHGLTNHGNSLFEPDVRVPLLISLPGETVRTVKGPVVLTDLSPTLLDLAGQSARASDGWNLAPLLFETHPHEAYAERPIHIFTDVQRGSVHYRAAALFRWPHKYIRDIRLGTEQVFDVLADPGEQRDLSAIRPALRAAMAEGLDSWLATKN